MMMIQKPLQYYYMVQCLRDYAEQNPLENIYERVFDQDYDATYYETTFEEIEEHEANENEANRENNMVKSVY